MAIDMYNTRTMLQALEQRTPPKTFLLDTFFKGVRQFASKYVDIDIVKGQRRLAPFVSPNLPGKVRSRDGYTTRTYAPPYLKPKMPCRAEDLLQRSPGNTVYGAESMAQRAARMVGEDLANLDQDITRREEWMAAQALDAGTIAVVGDGVNDTVDFGMDANHKVTLSGTDLWSAPSTANPLDDLVDWSQLVAKDSGLTPDVCIMGLSAWKAFRDFYIAKGANVVSPIQITLGKIDPKALPGGVSYMGSVNESGLALDIYTYQEWYVDDNGVTQPMVPLKKVWLGSTQAQNARLYGAILDMEANENFAVARFPKSWIEKDPSVRWIMLQSAALMALLQPDGHLSAQVLS